MSNNLTLETMNEARSSILLILKTGGPLGIGELSRRLGISYEGARQHLQQLQTAGWIARRREQYSGNPGRPRSSYHLTSAGEHLFPKEYDELAIALIDAIAETLGPKALRGLLAEVARGKAERWEPTLRNLSLEERLEALRGIYAQDDPHCRIELGDEAVPRLIAMNCPYLEVARRRPALCSVTVSVLRRLLGHEVVRTESFQAGNGRCVFEVCRDRALNPERTVFEWEKPSIESPAR